jgi:hypothetical protein
MTTVGMQRAGHVARHLRSFEHHGTGTVAEQDAGAAIIQSRMREKTRRRSPEPCDDCRSDEFLGNSQRIGEAGTNRLHVVGGGALLPSRPG